MGAERVAVVGSRDGADLEAVTEFLMWLHSEHPDAIVISGGARGVDKWAERRWVELGHEVWSFRVKQLGLEEYGIEAWHLGPNPRVEFLHGHPTAKDFKSAILYRDALVAEQCHRLVAFYKPGRSRGTALTVEFARDWEKKTVNEHEKERGWL